LATKGATRREKLPQKIEVTTQYNKYAVILLSRICYSSSVCLPACHTFVLCQTVDWILLVWEWKVFSAHPTFMLEADISNK